MSYQSTILATSGLVAYWPLDETSGTTATDQQAAFDGTYTGTFTLNQTGIGVATGPSVLLGPGYVDTPNTGPDLSSAFSVELWLNTSNNTNDRRIVVGTAGLANTAIYLSLDNLNNLAGSLWFANGIGGWSRILPGSAIAQGTDYHLVVTGDTSSNQLIRAYLNGVLSSDGAVQWTTGAGGITINDGLQWGRKYSGAFGNDFAGNMSNIAIYNTTLDATTILQHYDTGAGINPPASYYYRMLAGSGH